MNAKNFGAGMNLQCATDIIMYHRFSKEMEEQIIGRGQRLGREGTLNVYYLIHDNESSSYVDDKFNDMNFQEWMENIDDRDDEIYNERILVEPLIADEIDVNEADEVEPKKIVVKRTTKAKKISATDTNGVIKKVKATKTIKK